MVPLITAALGLAEFAPSLVRWLKGKNAEAIAQDVIAAARRATKGSTAEEAWAVLKQDSAAVAAFQKEALMLETQWELSLLEDRQAARERDLEFLRTGHANRRADLMVMAAAAGLVLCLLSLAFYSEVLPGEAVGIISTIAGIFGGCLKDAFAFEFGSSRGSKEKDTTVAAFLDRLN